MQTFAELKAKVESVGGFVEDPGINWRWASFPSNAAAEEFHKWLDDSWETRGVYKETPRDLAGVRFRRA